MKFIQKYRKFVTKAEKDHDEVAMEREFAKIQRTFRNNVDSTFMKTLIAFLEAKVEIHRDMLELQDLGTEKGKAKAIGLIAKNELLRELLTDFTGFIEDDMFAKLETLPIEEEISYNIPPTWEKRDVRP